MLNLKTPPKFLSFFKKPAFTLMELIIVIVVIGILVTMGMPSYINAKRRAVDREAQTQLKLIQAAEDVLELETGSYVGCGDNAECNQLLRIELPPDTDSDGNWDYEVEVSPDGSTFTATAAGDNGTQENWSIDEGEAEAD